MADIGYIKGLLRGVKDETTRRVLDQCFEHVLGNLREGAPEHQTRSVNFQRYWIKSTSASDTSVFSVAHGLPQAPRYAIPVLDLQQAGATTPTLKVSRAADARRIYLESASTNVPILLLVE